ncbi:MAG: helix-turn-helix transcriptional regulator [bacterium]|nr:helix-turn-helix transcriptional regulator [bacterium]
MENLGKIREKMKITQAELAKVMGVSQSTISRIEAGEHQGMRLLLSDEKYPDMTFCIKYMEKLATLHYAHFGEKLDAKKIVYNKGKK